MVKDSILKYFTKKVMKMDKTVFGTYKKVEELNVFKYWQTITVK